MMDSLRNAYCRLCAELKPNTKMQNLQIDQEKLREIIEKLSRINAVTDFNENSLPKMVCFCCITALDNAYAFVLAVEQAQVTLKDLSLAPPVKKEIEDSDDENRSYGSPKCKYEDDVHVKDELLRNNIESNVVVLKDDELLYRKSVVNPKKRHGSSLDAIPLSQLKLTWRDYSWMCAYCETQFLTVDELRVHSMEYHTCCNAFRCTDCNIRKLNLDSFLIHVRRHRKFLKLSCYKCCIRFTSLKEGRSHKNEHVTSEHICWGCNTCFVDVDALKKHVDTFYKDKRLRDIPKMQLMNSLTCVMCKKTFKNKGSLNTHLLTHTERKRDHICEICGKSFLHKQNLLGHMTLHNEARPFRCEICKCCFKTPYHLRRHVGTHDGHKPFACDQCGRCFRLQKQLKSHLIIHTDSLPHTCSYCNKGFRFKTILNQHLRQHTGVKPYSCDICQRDFTNWPNFNKHMKRRHGMDMARKKHTPDGVYPINPNTGEMVIFPETDETLEWKKNMMLQRKPGRPKHPFREEIKNNVEKSK